MIEIEVEPIPEETALRQVLAATKSGGVTPVRTPEGWVSELVTLTKEEMATPVGVKIANVTPHPVVLSISVESHKEAGLEEGETLPSRPLSESDARGVRGARAESAQSPDLRVYRMPVCAR